MTESGSPVVSMDAITKIFPGVKALDQVRDAPYDIHTADSARVG